MISTMGLTLLKDQDKAAEQGIGQVPSVPVAPSVPQPVTPPTEVLQNEPPRAPTQGRSDLQGGAAVTPETLLANRGAREVAPAELQRDASKYVSDSSTVAGQLSRLLGSDSRYIKEAERRGIEQGASRGMLNTSASAGAAIREAIAAGVPIASQDAETWARAQGRQQEGDITAALEAAGYRAEGILQEQKAGQIAEQSQQDYRQNLSRDRQQQLANTANIRIQGDLSQKLANSGFESADHLQRLANEGNMEAIALQGELNQMRDAANNDVAREMQETDAKNQKELLEMGIDADSSNLYTNILGTLTNTTIGSISQLLNNMDITDVEGAIEVLEGFLGSTAMGQSAFELNLSGRGAQAGTVGNETASQVGVVQAPDLPPAATIPPPAVAPPPTPVAPREPTSRDYWDRYR